MNMPQDKNKSSLIKPAILFLFLWLLFFYEFITRGNVLSGGDLVNQYIPYKQFFKDSVFKGCFPLWNPHTFSGRPFLGDIQIGLFYPPNWLCLLMPVPVFFTILTIIHLWFCSLGAFMFSSLFLKKNQSRYFFAITFSFSAFFVTRLFSGIVLFIFTASYIPWILHAAEIWRIKRTHGATVLLGALLALQLLAGSPQVAFYTWIALFILFFVQLKGSKSNIPLWRGYAVAIVVMLGISAVQFIPTKEYIDHSYERARGADWEYITDGSLEAKLLVSFLAPEFFAPPEREDISWGSAVGFWEYNGYLGIAPLVFILVFLVSGCFRRMFPGSVTNDSRKRLLFLFLALFIFWAFLSFGKNSFLFPLFFRFIPGFNRFRVPARLVIYYIISLSFFSSVAFDFFMDVIQEKSFDRKWRIRILISVLAVFFVCLFFSLFFFLKTTFVLKWLEIEKVVPLHLIGAPNTPFYDIPVFARKSVLIFSGFTFVSCVLIILMNFMKKSRVWHGALFVGLLLFDLFFIGIPYIESAPYREFHERYYPDTQVTEFLKNSLESYQRYTWMDSLIWWQFDQNQMEIYPNRGMMKGLYDTRGYDPVFLRRYGEFFNAIGRISGEKSPGAFLTLEKIYNHHLLSLLNVRYILTYVPLELQGWEKAEEFPTGLCVYENKNVLGNAFLVRHFAVPESHVSQTPKALMQSQTPLLQIAFSEDENPYRDSDKSKTAGEESVRLTYYSPNRREYDVKVVQSDTLVFSEVYYPGWRIYVNGDGVPSHIVDHALLGAFLPPGSHHVVCKYFPYSFIVGGIVSLITLMGVSLWIVFRKRLIHE
ncbi:YfhO family protein [Candidatus Sumerlaeota bacterium]|nr:YfhO family protein [Candidatus Sumerlaeota bacterium]